MNDLNYEIRTEAQTLCGIIKDHFDEFPPQRLNQIETLMKVIFRLEKLLKEHEAPNPQR